MKREKENRDGREKEEGEEENKKWIRRQRYSALYLECMGLW